ncbi:MAG: flagellar basal-body rod protein FlgF [Paracoccus denitrificans]|nr:MAG: flagellar basal-body rod protein FlgF [Paracoccus denitrificans]PZO83979.1 MAG: flagellar basal-body rod protein FlgF [Paracoccus denitrificans]
MDNAVYAALTRQSGLMREMQSIANNIANANTSGFRREGVLFAEHMSAIGGGDTLSMGTAKGRDVDLSHAALESTGGTWDLALDGDGFFMLATPQGNRLTRAGAFMPSAEGEIVNLDGYALLDDGGAPIVVPPDLGAVSLGPDGTVSAGGQPVARVGVFDGGNRADLRHDGGTLFAAADPQVLDDATVRQGFLEGSNVDPVVEMARMIDVQRAYQLSQSFMDAEDQRIRAAITALTR